MTEHITVPMMNDYPITEGDAEEVYALLQRYSENPDPRFGYMFPPFLAQFEGEVASGTDIKELVRGLAKHACRSREREASALFPYNPVLDEFRRELFGILDLLPPVVEESPFTHGGTRDPGRE